jgi:DNA processing protein
VARPSGFQIMDDLTSIIALSRLPGINRQKKRQLLDTVKSPALLFKDRNRFLDSDIACQLRSFDGWRQIEKELVILGKMEVTPVTIRDKEYPALLQNIPDPPLVLYRKGPLDISSDTIAIVGSRRATFAGLNLAEKIAGTLSSLGVTVVSGFARGIDTASHRGAIKEKGKTIAVLGCGMDICYPVENKRLFEVSTSLKEIVLLRGFQKVSLSSRQHKKAGP